MGTFVQPHNINYATLDFDKYLVQLRRKYELLSKINQLPRIDDKIKILRADNPKSKELKSLQALSNEYRYILPEIDVFWGRVKNSNDNKKEYHYFTREELLQLEISDEFVRQNFELIDQKIDYKIGEIEYRKQGSPMPEKDFYSDESVYLLDFDFNYLDEIVDSKIAPNLDREQYAKRFFNEVINVKAQIYVAQKLESENASQLNITPIKWNANINELATIFIELLNAGAIASNKENIKRFLINNFIDKNRKSISKSSLDDIFKPSKYKESGKVSEGIQNLIESLTLQK